MHHLSTGRLLAAVTAALAMTALVAGVSIAAPGNSVIYSSLVSSPLHGNMPSFGAEAYAFNEFGNAVTFSASQNRSLSSAVVTMSSWGCQSGHWNTGNCLTTKGATFSTPITFSVYDADKTLIASATQTFAIPYRPSASTKCGDGRWYDNALKSCFNGFATNITFSFSGQTLPNNVFFGIAYNTTHYGDSPIGESASCFTSSGGCGYDSLNIAMSTESDISAGSDTNPGQIWVDGVMTADYDPPLIPAVQIKASR